jgi:hypothetical protein
VGTSRRVHGPLPGALEASPGVRGAAKLPIEGLVIHIAHRLVSGFGLFRYVGDKRFRR